MDDTIPPRQELSCIKGSILGGIAWFAIHLFTNLPMQEGIFVSASRAFPRAIDGVGLTFVDQFYNEMTI